MGRHEATTRIIARCPATIRSPPFWPKAVISCGCTNRPGNVNDGKSSIPFLGALFTQVEETLGSGYALRCRMDGDYFKKEVLEDVGRAAKPALPSR